MISSVAGRGRGPTDGGGSRHLAAPLKAAFVPKPSVTQVDLIVHKLPLTPGFGQRSPEIGDRLVVLLPPVAQANVLHSKLENPEQEVVVTLDHSEEFIGRCLNRVPAGDDYAKASLDDLDEREGN
jgi:hypothetical protein